MCGCPLFLFDSGANRTRCEGGGHVFTGIVEERGEVVDVEQLPNAARLTVAGRF